MSTPAVLTSTVLSASAAAQLAADHAAAVHERAAAHLARRARGEKHPVEDFLHTYYPFTPGQLSTWHPGAGVVVQADDHGSAFLSELAGRKWYRAVDPARASAAVPLVRASPTSEAGSPPQAAPASAAAVTVDLASWRTARGDGALFIRDLLARTLEREGTFGCFGLHEWAMVYKQSPDEVRHDQVPLRLTHAQTDTVVESHRVRCSHFDAFRFFTPEARPLNELAPTRDTMQEMEQPGCLHGGMDLYKWAMKLGPIVPSDVTLAAFDLARDIRTLDMEASPYDVRDWGYGVVAIETTAGKAEYVRRQRGFADRGNEIRRRLITAIDTALADEAAALDTGC